MKVLELKIMRGPNYWSNYRNHLIVVKLDLEELERSPTHKIDGFLERIKTMMPSLASHRCSEGQKGGFFTRVEQGTWMGHVIEHLALEIQTLAGMDVGYGRTRSTDTPGVYYVVFAYRVEEAGRYAAKAAIRIAEALVKGVPYNLQDDIDYLKKIYKRQKLGPSTQSIVREAQLRNIPFKRLNRNSLILFGYGYKIKKIRATVADTTAGIGIEIAKDKFETKAFLQGSHIPTPKGFLVYDEDELADFLDEIAFPLVIKPYDGSHGRGITTNIRSKEQAVEAFRFAAAISTPVIMEEFVSGSDYRLVVVNFKLVAAAKRKPAMVTGDGGKTIRALVDDLNADPRRGEGHDRILSKIEIDHITEALLKEKGLTPDSVPAAGQQVVLKHTANISAGGSSEDVTDMVHPYNIFIAERVARMLNLNICGIDVVTNDISKPLNKSGGAIVEVTAAPGLRMHHHPTSGLPRNVARPIIDMMFPGNDNGRIPLVAITGTNGKTTTTRLIAHLAQFMGHRVGFTTTDGIYIQGHTIFEGDCTGPVSAETVLYDPTVDFAVLECARGGILRSGLAFDTSDISVVTNISPDHLGMKDINSVEEMARVKIVVPKTTSDDGYAILNADDDLVYNMREELDCKIALFTMDSHNKRVKEHCDRGGLAAMSENGYLTICQGQWKTRLERLEAFPLTLGGRSETMIKNLMPAALVGFIRNMPVDRVRAALLAFYPSPDSTPGRMNLFKFREFELMLDYAHNADGFLELKKFLAKTTASVKTGIVAVTGDRRDEDQREIGRISAEMFDEIIIRHDTDLRGSSKEHLDELLLAGIHEIKPDMPVKIISDEIEAIQYAIDHAEKNSFILVCGDKIKQSIEFLKTAIEKDRLKPFVARHPG